MLSPLRYGCRDIRYAADATLYFLYATLLDFRHMLSTPLITPFSAAALFSLMIRRRCCLRRLLTAPFSFLLLTLRCYAATLPYGHYFAMPLLRFDATPYAAATL